MSAYKIVTAELDSVYCVVTLDDGSSFGQTVHGQASMTEAGIEQAIREAIERVEAGKKATVREQKVRDVVLSGASKQLPVLQPAPEVLP